MKYKVLLLALAAITTSCSPQADINYQIIPEQPQLLGPVSPEAICL